MKNKLFSAVCVLLALTLLALPVFAEDNTDTVNDVISVVDGIIDWNLERTGSASVQEWIDGTLTENAGMTSEWYIFTLSRSGDYDFSAYEKALTDYIGTNTIRSASTRLKLALVLRAIGSTNDYIASTLNDSIGQQGIMSWVYGLHLMTSGVVCEAYTVSDVISTLIDLQLEDGGWALTGQYGDTDVTAMTLQTLTPYYDSDESVKAAADRALDFLSSRQQDDGGYASYGVSNPESAAQVLVTLSSLGIDFTEDERFIKDGKTLLDGIVKYKLDDGGYCHMEGGAANETATVQAYYSMVSYLRLKEGKTPLYIIEDDKAADQSVPETEAEPESVTESSEETAAETDAPETDVSETDAETSPATVITEPAESADIISPDTDDESADEHAGENAKANSRLTVCLIIAGVGCAVCLILFIIGKRSPKNFIAVIILTGLAVLIVSVTDFQSADEYYSGETADKANAVGTVTMTIRCDTVAGKNDAEHIPADGVILDVTEFVIAEGDSVYDILTEAAQKYHIQVENDGSWDYSYISGIGYLYEYDFGDLSGWIYHVNGEAPSVGCGEYILSDGDEIEWLYTCDLGEDVK